MAIKMLSIAEHPLDSTMEECTILPARGGVNARMTLFYETTPVTYRVTVGTTTMTVPEFIAQYGGGSYYSQSNCLPFSCNKGAAA